MFSHNNLEREFAFCDESGWMRIPPASYSLWVASDYRTRGPEGNIGRNHLTVI